MLKDYLLRGYAINQRVQYVEQRINKQLQEHTERIHNLENKVGFFVQTALPPVEGIFLDGQIFDAYAFASDLIRSAQRRIILIDNYIDDSVLLMLAKRVDGVTAEIVTRRITETLTLDIERHNLQYPPVTITISLSAKSRCEFTPYESAITMQMLRNIWNMILTTST